MTTDRWNDDSCSVNNRPSPAAPENADDRRVAERTQISKRYSEYVTNWCTGGGPTVTPCFLDLAVLRSGKDQIRPIIRAVADGRDRPYRCRRHHDAGVVTDGVGAAGLDLHDQHFGAQGHLEHPLGASPTRPDHPSTGRGRWIVGCHQAQRLMADEQQRRTVRAG